MLGWTLATLVVTALGLIGVAGCVAPGIAARQYGILVADRRALAFVRAMAVRDLVIGAVLGLIALDGARTTLGRAMIATAVVPIVDLVLVIADRRATAQHRLDGTAALHASGMLGLVVAAVALLAGW